MTAFAVFINHKKWFEILFLRGIINLNFNTYSFGIKNRLHVSHGIKKAIAFS